MSLPSIVAFGKYVCVFDQYGNQKVLEIPSTRSIMFADSDGSIKWVDGSEGGILLDNILISAAANAAATHLLASLGNGNIIKFAAPPADSNQKVLICQAGVMKWQNLVTGQTIPETGSGFIIRLPSTDADPTPIPSFLGGGWDGNKGVPVVNDDGTMSLLQAAQVGFVLKQGNDGPEWGRPSSGSVIAGGSATGMSGVTAHNSSAAAVSVKVPTISLTNGIGGNITLSDVDVSASLAAATGAGGLDTGTEESNKWYYVYIISDGADAVDCIISLDPDAPDFTNAPSFSYYALASVIRNNGSGNIVKFFQRGRKFSILPTEVSTGVSSTTSFAAVTQTNALTGIIPPIASAISGMVGGSNGETDSVKFMFIASSSDAVGKQLVGGVQVSTITPQEGFYGDAGSFYDLIIDDPTAPALYWKSSAASTHRRLVLTGYSI